MSAAKKKTEKTWELTGSWAGAWKIFAGVGVLGLAAAAAGATSDPRRFAFSWLFAFITCLMIALGSLFFVLVQRLTSAGWSVTVRRTAEFFGNGIVILIPLFLPVLIYMGHLFPWLGEHGGHGVEEHASLSLVRDANAAEPVQAPGEPAHETATATAPAAPAAGAGHAAGASHEGAPEAGNMPGRFGDHGGPRPGPGLHAGGTAASVHASHALHHAELMAKKSGWLNKNFFLLRVGIYFLVWIVLAVRLFGYSTAQDSSKDPELTLAAQRFSPPAMFLFALSLTFAVFDWVMALEPSWFSTIFGVYMFATCVVSSLAVIILVTMALRNAGPLDGAVTVEHYHDLGKLLFGFLVFWAYIGFSQFMLIWYAALPEETTWYHNRWDFAPWATVSTAILLGHFVLPFFWLISRTFKRNLGRLQVGAMILLVMHVVDIYWFVMPNYHLGKDGFSFHWLDVACLLAVGGIYGAFVFFRMTKFSLIPVGDPRLDRALHFQNA